MLAVDLGGTRVKVGLVQGGAAREVHVAEHGADTLAGALVCVDDLIGQVAPAGCASVGMCVPGLVDEQGGVIALPGKLTGAVGADLVGWLERRTGGTARVINDALAYGLGEAHGLAGRTVVVTIGTGVGTAVIEDGRPLGQGVLGGGLLAGQLPLTEHGPTDTAGRVGTVEAWCRADRIRAEVVAAGRAVPDVRAACAAAAAGDPAAQQGVAAYCGHLARGLAALCLAYAPDTVVVGGGPVTPDGLLLRGLPELVEALLWPGQRVRLQAARHGDSAALIGLSVPA